MSHFLAQQNLINRSTKFLMNSSSSNELEKTISFDQKRLSEWSNDIKNYKTTKQGFNPFDIQKPKQVTIAEVKLKETIYNPILQSYRDPSIEKQMKESESLTFKIQLAQNRDNQLKQEQLFNIVNLEGRLKGLEKCDNFPKEKLWKPKFTKNTNQDHNIISNFLLQEHHFNPPDNRPLPIKNNQGSGKKITRNLSSIREFNILTNRYLNQDKEKSRQASENFLVNAATTYWKHHGLDPINQVFYDTQKEKDATDVEEQKKLTHAQTYYKRIPVALQKDGLAYNVVSNEAKDVHKVELLDSKIKNRIKRFEVKGEYESMARKRSMFIQDQKDERVNSKISPERFKIPNLRGFDIVSGQELSQSPNNDKKQEFYQQCQKPKPWEYINNSKADAPLKSGRIINYNSTNVSRLDLSRNDLIDSSATTTENKLEGFRLLKRNDRINLQRQATSVARRNSIRLVRTGAFNMM